MTNFEIQNYYQSEPKFEGAYSQNNLPKTLKDEAYIVNREEYRSIGKHWIALYDNSNSVTYFDTFDVEHIPEEIKRFIGNKNVITNIFRIQAYDSIKCEYLCLAFIDFTLKKPRQMLRNYSHQRVSKRMMK